MKVILPFLLFSSSVFSSPLPAIFYAEPEEKEAFCSRREFQNELYWRELTDHKISRLTAQSSDVAKNSYVTLSYLELFKVPGKYAPTAFMGYVYANASHHLGRLVRFKKWPDGHLLQDNDRKLVKGPALRAAAEMTSHELSKRLMLHSLRLYKELSWSLASASLCGSEYTREMISDENLRAAFESDTIEDFILPFVTYEQTYLQKTMYSDWVIGNAARARILDEMRFISFNGEEHPDFKSWCKLTNCETSSYDLKNRITFDTTSIKNELNFIGRRSESLLKRVTRAKIAETAEVFTK